MTKLIGITGGIGSGKSVVCRICALKGIPVYDCDSRAKNLMLEDTSLRCFLTKEVGEDVYNPITGELNKKLLSAHIFCNKEIGKRVQARVHEAVRCDIRQWIASLPQDTKIAIVESAILHTSALDNEMDHIWLVTAPEKLRVERVKSRSGLSEEDIYARINAQNDEFDSMPSDKVSVIVNDDNAQLLPRIMDLIKDVNTRIY